MDDSLPPEQETAFRAAYVVAVRALNGPVEDVSIIEAAVAFALKDWSLPTQFDGDPNSENAWRAKFSVALRAAVCAHNLVKKHAIPVHGIDLETLKGALEVSLREGTRLPDDAVLLLRRDLTEIELAGVMQRL